MMIDTRAFEGLRLRVYKCTAGKKTVGYGHNMERAISKRIFLKMGISHKDVIEGKRSLTVKEANEIFRYDMAVIESEVRDVVTSFDQHPELVRTIIKDLMFNMGKTRFSKFVKTIDALNKKDYKTAAKELKDSRWYYQVGRRSKAIVAALRSFD